MLSSLPPLTIVAPPAAPWSDVLISAGMGALGLVQGLRIWHGKPVYPWQTLETKSQLKFLKFPLLPCSVMFFCFAAIGLLSEAAAATTGAVLVVALIAEVLIAMVALVAFLVAMSLFFFWRPKRFVPPRLRRR